jgi:hypothetical protein
MPWLEIMLGLMAIYECKYWRLFSSKIADLLKVSHYSISNYDE